MAVRISVMGASFVSIRIGKRSRVEVAMPSAGVRLLIGGADDTFSIYSEAPGRNGRDVVALPRAARAAVTPEMEAAAVRAFLASADAARLGHSLAAVYEAMETARRGRDGDD